MPADNAVGDDRYVHGARYTMDVQNFTTYVNAMFSTLRVRAKELLAQRRAERRFKARRHRRRAQDVVANFVAGTESLRLKRRCEQLERRKNQEALTDDEIIALFLDIEGTRAERIEDAKHRTIKIVFFGDGCFRPTARGMTAVPRKAIVKLLAARGIVVITDEFHSSMYCACQDKKLEDAPADGQAGKARPRRHEGDSAPCSFLKVFEDRDALAAVNILVCGICALWGEARPAPFRRHTAETA